MDPLDTYQRLQALGGRRAVPRATRRHVHLSARPLVLAAYHMAGELGAPLAIIWGTSPDPATAGFLAVPEPRNRSLRFDALERFGAALDAYLSPLMARETVPVVKQGRLDGTEESCRDAPQIVVPNATTAAWLFGIVGRFTRYLPITGPDAVPATVRRAGANLTFFEQTRVMPGSSVALAATDILATHFATGQLDGETQNLAATLGWIDPDDGLDGAAAAAEAERTRPPAGPLSDPTWDADVLEHLISAYHAATRERGKQRAADDLAAAAREQLEPGWSDTWHALAVLRRLPTAAHVEQRWRRDRYYWSRHAERIESGTARFRRVPDPLQAARALNRAEQLTDELAAQMALDDPAVMVHAIARGDALAGTVAAVDPLRREPNDNGRSVVRPSLTIAADVPFTRPAGTTLHLADSPAVAAVVTALAAASGGQQLVTLTVTAGANNATTRGRLPLAGARVILSPYGPLAAYPDTLPSAVPWTHRLPEQEHA